MRSVVIAPVVLAALAFSGCAFTSSLGGFISTSCLKGVFDGSDNERDEAIKELQESLRDR